VKIRIPIGCLEDALQASVEALDRGGRFELRADLASDEALADIHRQLAQGITEGRAIQWVPVD
jgi:hypothetical protein